MDQTLGKEYPPEKRVDFLKANCDAVEKKSYMRRYTPDELMAMKESLSGVAIAINDIEDEKKEVIAEIKDRLEPLKEQMKETLRGLKEKAVLVTGECFKMVDTAERMVGYYNEEGDLIEARPANADELQGTILQVIRNTGTDN